MTGSNPELTEKVEDQHHGTNKAWLDWFGFVNSKLILQTEFVQLAYHHGTDPWFHRQG